MWTSSVLQNTSLAWMAVVIGAVSLFYFFSKKKRTPPRQNTQAEPTSTAQGILQRLSDKCYSGWKVCITFDVLATANKSFDPAARKNLAQLCRLSQVFVLCRLQEAKDVDLLLNELMEFKQHGLMRNNILFSTTDKACEAFCRQITPTLLITGLSENGQFLSKFLPFVIIIGDCPNASTKQNISHCSSFAALPL